MPQQEQNVIVLVADDEPSTLALVASHVRSRGYTVLEASDGDQAWQLAHEHLPDLVILDVMMPGMSGWEVCRKIREAVSLAHTGVIMLTGIGENLNEMTSPLYGADTYLDKPFEFTTLDAKVVETLADRKKGAMGRPDPEVAAARESSRPPPPKTNGLVLTKARTKDPAAPKAKKPAKATAKEAAPREAARPLVKATPRKGAPVAAKPAKKKRSEAKASKAKAAPKKASAKSATAPKAAKKATTKKAAAKAATKKATAKAVPKKAAKATTKKAAAKKAKSAAPAKAKAKAKRAGKRRPAAKAAPKKAAPKRTSPKKAAPKAATRKRVAVAGASALPPAAKKRKAPVASTPSGDATV